MLGHFHYVKFTVAIDCTHVRGFIGVVGQEYPKLVQAVWWYYRRLLTIFKHRPDLPLHSNGLLQGNLLVVDRKGHRNIKRPLEIVGTRDNFKLL